MFKSGPPHKRNDDVWVETEQVGGVPWGCLTLLVATLLVLVCLGYLASQGGNAPARPGIGTAPAATPSPMWHPDAEWTGVPSFGRVPDPGVRPVID